MARGSGGGGGTKKLQIGDLLQTGIIMVYSRSISIAVVAIAVVCFCIYILQILILNTAAGFNPYSRTSLLQCTLLDQNQSSTHQITSESSRSNSSRTQNSYTQQEQQQQQNNNTNNIVVISELNESPGPKSRSGGGTELSRIVFGIATAAKNWSRRKEYIKLWWNSSSCCNNRNNNSSCCNNNNDKNSSCSSTRMRGFVWLDEEVNETHWSEDWPPYKISEDVSDKSKFNWSNVKRKWGVRISRIVSETFRLGLPNVDWFVLGDDDTFFFPQNLVKVLSRYDHTQMRYIGSFSETHSQNIMLFSYNMAFGGGGFAISFPLAQALAQMQDECNFRYGQMFGSDDRLYACISELGVPLTKNPGFHQMDINGDPFGILAAHPVTPILSIHHLDAISPIFPNKTRLQALQKLTQAAEVESGSVVQQSICYDKELKWSFSVSWGYVVHIHAGFLTPHEMMLPIQTFASIHRKWDKSEFSFTTRAYSKDRCTHPIRYFVESVRGPNSNFSQGLLESVYSKEQ